LILKEAEVVCFHALLQALILKRLLSAEIKRITRSPTKKKKRQPGCRTPNGVI
jgi:hypothetical protein